MLRIARSNVARTSSVVLALALSGAGCREATPRATSTATAPGETTSAGGAPPATSMSRGDAVTPVYPVDAGPLDPLAVRLCDAIHTLPETRKAACCHGKPTGTLASECARTLTVALRDGSVALDAPDVDRCIAAAESRFDGCDWVTPLAPRLPDECQDLLVGLVAEGGTCRSALDCGQGRFCAGATPTTKGICTAPGATGATCGSPTDTLATYTGQFDYARDHPECEGFCRGGRCAPALAVGGSCSADLQCGAHAWCDKGRCVSGTRPAVVLKAAGQACSSPFECQASCVMTPGGSTGMCGPQCVRGQ